MKKNIAISLIILIAIGMTGFGAFKYGHSLRSTFDSNPNTNVTIEPETQIPLSEILISNILIPVNDGKRQKLLLLDLAIYSKEENAVEVEKQRSKLKNVLLKKFSAKPNDYYYSVDFIDTLQSDISNAFSKLDGKIIQKVYVTKAVYQ